MKDILHKLYRNSTTLMELFDSQIEGTTLKERLMKFLPCFASWNQKRFIHKFSKNVVQVPTTFSSIYLSVPFSTLIKAIEEELLESIGEDNNELITKLNNIEDEISNLVVDDTRRAFLKGISYGMFVGMGVIRKEREKIPLNKEWNFFLAVQVETRNALFINFLKTTSKYRRPFYQFISAFLFQHY